MNSAVLHSSDGPDPAPSPRVKLGANRDSVTLETKCWEGDWRLLLKTDRLKVLADRNRFPFAQEPIRITPRSDK
jgi:hypothetical protein